MVIGEMKDKITLDKNGEVKVQKIVPISMTVDERIADGFYFAKSFKILKYLIENPSYLDQPLSSPIDFEV